MEGSNTRRSCKSTMYPKSSTMKSASQPVPLGAPEPSCPRVKSESSIGSLQTRQHMKSASIPISNCIRRTPSESQLCEDEAVADYKDYLFYSRIVNGIAMQQRRRQDGYLRYENQMCLAHIVRTRHSNDQAPTSSPNKKFDTMSGDWSHDFDMANQFNYNSHFGYLADPVAGSTEDEEIFILDL